MLMQPVLAWKGRKQPGVSVHVSCKEALELLSNQNLREQLAMRGKAN